VPERQTSRLDAMPSLAPLYARAGLGAVPGSGLLARLPLFPGAVRGDELPAGRLGVDAVGADREAVARYCRVCGFTVRDALPPTYPHVMSFPLQMELMASPAFPFPLLGLVHLDDAITQHRPVAAGERLDFEVGATDLRAHRRGLAFSLVVEARSGDELVWEERGTILHRGDGDPAADPEPAPAALPDDTPAAAEWRLPGDLGRRYAAVSGDRNPIHIHPLTARAFGFPRPIAHGMWSMARCLAQLEGRVPDSFIALAAFRKPVALPGSVRFAAGPGVEGSTLLALRGTEPVDPPVHLIGELAPRP
jgi:acyl dehydratase